MRGTGGAELRSADLRRRPGGSPDHGHATETADATALTRDHANGRSHVKRPKVLVLRMARRRCRPSHRRTARVDLRQMRAGMRRELLRRDPNNTADAREWPPLLDQQRAWPRRTLFVL